MPFLAPRLPPSRSFPLLLGISAASHLLFRASRSLLATWRRRQHPSVLSHAATAPSQPTAATGELPRVPSAPLPTPRRRRPVQARVGPAKPIGARVGPTSRRCLLPASPCTSARCPSVSALPSSLDAAAGLLRAPSAGSAAPPVAPLRPVRSPPRRPLPLFSPLTRFSLSRRSSAASRSGDLAAVQPRSGQIRCPGGRIRPTPLRSRPPPSPARRPHRFSSRRRPPLPPRVGVVLVGPAAQPKPRPSPAPAAHLPPPPSWAEPSGEHA
nr:pistil-specific extensin-like protein [Aegilops tauschii subsp. strangulata]